MRMIAINSFLFAICLALAIAFISEYQATGYYRDLAHKNSVQIVSSPTQIEKPDQNSFWEQTVDDPVKFWAAITAVFTVFLAVSTIGLWKATYKQASIATDSAKLARDDFEATHRPWLQTDIRIGERGLSFDNNGANLHLIYTCKNIGTSPAKNVAFQVRPAFSRKTAPFGSKEQQEWLLTAQKEISDRERQRPYHPWAISRTVFPGENFTENMTYTFCNNNTLAEIDAELGGHGMLSSLTVYGLVDYRFTFGNDTNHQTGFAYSVSFRDPQDGRVKGFRHPGNDIAGEHLFLQTWHQGAAFFAD